MFGRAHALAEEILLHLFHDGFLIFTTGRIEAVFVEEHFAEIHPLIPGLLRDVVVNLLAEFRVEWRFVETGKFFLQLDAENFVLCHKVAKIIS